MGFGVISSENTALVLFSFFWWVVTWSNVPRLSESNAIRNNIVFWCGKLVVLLSIKNTTKTVCFSFKIWWGPDNNSILTVKKYSNLVSQSDFTKLCVYPFDCHLI